MSIFYLPSDRFHYAMEQYQIWFKSSVMFWLQTIRDECETNVEKTLRPDRDVSRVIYKTPKIVLISS